MQLFELVSPRLFRPLAGPNRAFYAELLLLLWEECRHTADYSISRAEAVLRAEDYFAALAKPLALDADGAGDEEEQPTRDPHTLAVGFLLPSLSAYTYKIQNGMNLYNMGIACGLFAMMVVPILTAFGDKPDSALYWSTGHNAELVTVLTVLCIITLAVFAVRACRAGRSSFYTIAACAATSLLVFQTCLNVFGAVDILPFTGVTLPFVSNGGSSMLSAWGMLAFLKATDTRQNASFAVRLPSRRELRGED